MGTYTLESNRLKVKIAASDEGYKGTRFDWTGMIKEVILDNAHKFASKESLVEGIGSGGEGFYNEFGIEEPIGYDDAKIGETFPKIGVGLLKKESKKDYDFFHTYEVEPFEIEIKETNNSLELTSNTKGTRGYSAKYVKKISLEEDEMIIEYYLKNTGDKDIDTTEYCHNFTNVDDNPMGPDYEIEFSYPIDVDPKTIVGNFRVNNNKIQWDEAVKDTVYCKLKNFSKESGQYFQVIHKPSGVGYRETSHFVLERVAIWGMSHVISPEAFVKIKISPGEEQTWKRVYKFFD